MSEEQAEIPSIISLGRLIQEGVKLEWKKEGAVMVLPNKRRIDIPVQNNCPYANDEVLEFVKNCVALKRRIEE